MSELKTSMPTNEERREAAAMLRWFADFASGGNELFAKLADLIEPTERTCYMNEYDAEGYTVPESICGDGYCSECNGIIAVEDRYCPHCGAKVVS